MLQLRMILNPIFRQYINVHILPYSIDIVIEQQNKIFGCQKKKCLQRLKNN